MIKHYIKQAIRLLRENKLLSIISILGTALAICMIMVLVILYVMNTADFRPETNRSRTCYISTAMSMGKDDGRRMSFSALGYPLMKECVLSLKSAELVTAIIHDSRSKTIVSTMDGLSSYSASVTLTDATFWKLYSFDFIDGQPFSEADFKSGIRSAVINETVALRLFGTTKALGKQMKFDFTDFRVAGVVKDVSRFASKAWAEVWVPYSINSGYDSEASGQEGINGDYACCALLKKGYTRDDMRKEMLHLLAGFNSHMKDYKADLNVQPRTQVQEWLDGGSEFESHESSMYIRSGIIIAILLLVPALNLSGITLSRMRRRMPELGVRRAFGATEGNILWQVMLENLLFTFIGGLIGLILSYAGMLILKDWLLVSGETGLSIGMFSWEVFAAAFLLCLVLNLLSAGIPAWRVSRLQITDSLNS